MIATNSILPLPEIVIPQETILRHLNASTMAGTPIAAKLAKKEDAKTITNSAEAVKRAIPTTQSVAATNHSQKPAKESNHLDKALIKALDKNDEKLALKLIRKGANPNTIDPISGNTVLMKATARGYAKVVSSLLHRGADANIQNSNGYTALMLAASSKDIEGFEKILDAPDINLSLKTKKKRA